MPRGVYPRTEDHKRKISESLRGHSVSEEARKKMSEANRGRVHTEEHRRKNADGVSQSWTPERREELSARMTERFVDEENRLVHGQRGMNGKEVARGFSYSTSGYRVLHGQQGHALATTGPRGGQVLEHRKALYDEIGPGPHECHWNGVSGCGKISLEWGGRSGIQADHLNGDKLNNDPENLVPSCIGCNIRRHQAGNPVDWHPQ